MEGDGRAEFEEDEDAVVADAVGCVGVRGAARARFATLVIGGDVGVVVLDERACFVGAFDGNGGETAIVTTVERRVVEVRFAALAGSNDVRMSAAPRVGVRAQMLATVVVGALRLCEELHLPIDKCPTAMAAANSPSDIPDVLVRDGACIARVVTHSRALSESTSTSGENCASYGSSDDGSRGDRSRCRRRSSTASSS